MICLVLLGRHRANTAITTVAGDAICADHAALRADCVSLVGALHVARTELETPRAVRAMRPLTLLADPLSAREQVVLRYLASNLSASEIAAELFVSINTVKTHKQGIYRKLGVTGGRRPAVAQARLFGLL